MSIPQSDRFIPNRGFSNKTKMISHYNLLHDRSENELSDWYSLQLSRSMFDMERVIEDVNVLAVRKVPVVGHVPYARGLSWLYARNRWNKKKRFVEATPERVLDVPGIVDNFYYNVLDWSCEGIVAIALGDALYLWNTITDEKELVFQLDETITSVKFAREINNARYLAVGCESGTVIIVDIVSERVLRKLKSHNDAVVSCDWNVHVLTTGGRDGAVHNYDVRVTDFLISEYLGHDGSVCGLSWNNNGQFLATGSNDNLVNIWDYSMSRVVHQLSEHTAAVKALDWCPWENNILATGGGTDDKTIKIWNTATGRSFRTTKTSSQVCALKWAKNQKELISSEGYDNNVLTLWNYPTMEKITDLKGHLDRPLYLAISPDGTQIISASPDETIRVWTVWEKKIPSKPSKINISQIRTIR